ncbi:flagellar hook-associated protein FlgL [Bisbaumannia pacifica]|uniref:Flagellar hook-associated protein FlgL n=1 Tax=Bisbaumannia pacifica TaxID=77098 RepID=A0ABD4L0S7_9GAMM|nr:flagellar hook-associated protein FlgL [Halomonas pacifica]MBH8579893.1 flagellar hook-associated protein FlgL [Halomonas pacifica]
MRISTQTLFQQSVNSLNRQQGAFMEIAQQIASGKRVSKPSDDPQAASRAVGVDQAKAVTQQYMDARVSARNALAQSESVLNSASDGITRAKTLLLQASSDVLSDVDRNSVASELKGLYESLLGQANSTDGNGRYLFGGYRDDAPPFAKDAGGAVQYEGDSRNREQQIDAARKMPVTDTGADIFQSVHASAGLLAKADGGNAGNVTYGSPLTTDLADPAYGQQHRIVFSDDGAGGFDYEIFDAGGASVQAGAYSEGMRLEVAGMAMELEGTPAAGDELTLGRATEMEPDLFRTLENTIAVLESPADTPAEKAARRNTLNTGLRELDNAQDNILTVRASVGARLNELDVVDSVAGNRMINYEQTLSDLVDLDYVEAAADYSLRRVGLMAAQKAFVDIQGASLFDQL